MKDKLREDLILVVKKAIHDNSKTDIVADTVITNCNGVDHIAEQVADELEKDYLKLCEIVDDLEAYIKDREKRVFQVREITARGFAKKLIGQSTLIVKYEDGSEILQTSNRQIEKILKEYEK